jgi:hypothetical protein
LELKSGRGGEIRTHDLLYPKQARYQATLRPDSEENEFARRQPERQCCFYQSFIKNQKTGPAEAKSARQDGSIAIHAQPIGSPDAGHRFHGK